MLAIKPNYMIKKLITTEIKHFRSLPTLAQDLLLSYGLYGLVIPLVFTFVNAFILRTFQGLEAIVIYNVAFFLAIVIGFYVNGWLFRFFSCKQLYSVGLLGQGLTLLTLFWLSFSSLPMLFVFGLFQGIFNGFYWANRNFLSIEVTEDANRTYFVGLEMTQGTLTGIVTPFVIGLIVAFSKYASFLTITVAYQFLGVLALLLLIAAVRVLGASSINTPPVPEYKLRYHDKAWNMIRVSEVFWGVLQGSGIILPSVIVFALVGEEGTLGTLQSLSAVVAAVVTYSLARKLKMNQRLGLLTFATLGLIVLTTLLSVVYTPIVAVLFLLLLGPLQQLLWMSRNPIVMRVTDEQDNGNANTNYRYVVDRELLLNIGRIGGLLILWLALKSISDAAAIRIVVFTAGVLQIGVIWLLSRVEKMSPVESISYFLKSIQKRVMAN